MTKMTTIVLVNEIDAGHLAEVTADMSVLGAPRIRVIDGGDIYYAIEGSHRTTAAANLGLAVEVEIVDFDGTIDLDTLDWDDNGWFDERVVSVREFWDRFSAGGCLMHQPTVDVDVAIV
jgi:hypothetical protein